jgi:hypothetical protein
VHPPSAQLQLHQTRVRVLTEARRRGVQVAGLLQRTVDRIAVQEAGTPNHERVAILLAEVDRRVALPAVQLATRLAEVTHTHDNVASRNVGFRAGEVAHAAVSRRPPIPLTTSVARAEGFTYAAKAWALPIAQGPFPVAPVPNHTTTRNVTTRNFSRSAVGDGTAAGGAARSSGSGGADGRLCGRRGPHRGARVCRHRRRGCRRRRSSPPARHRHRCDPGPHPVA